MNHLTNVLFKRPDFSSLRKAGFTLTDMHFHCLYSDTYTRIDGILRRAAALGINLALTDHNCINGVAEAYNNRYKVNVIPGIEVSCKEGHHILIYFPTFDELRDFYLQHVEGRQGRNPYSNTSISTIDLLGACNRFSCLTAAAHPFAPGYYGIEKNINRGFISQDLFNRLDAVEAICGANLRRFNLKALELIEADGKPFVGGSDGHSLHQLGDVVICTKASTTPGILSEIRGRRNLVIGKESIMPLRLLSMSKIASKHFRYLEPTLQSKYSNLYKKSLKYYKGRIREKLP